MVTELVLLLKYKDQAEIASCIQVGVRELFFIIGFLSEIVITIMTDDWKVWTSFTGKRKKKNSIEY